MQALDHIVDGVPSGDNIAQQLDQWQLNRLRWGPSWEPTFDIAISDNIIEEVTLLT